MDYQRLVQRIESAKKTNTIGKNAMGFALYVTGVKDEEIFIDPKGFSVPKNFELVKTFDECDVVWLLESLDGMLLVREGKNSRRVHYRTGYEKPIASENFSIAIDNMNSFGIWTKKRTYYRVK